MSQVNTNAIYDASGGQSAKLYGVSMRNGGTGWVNRIINGDMRIDQRNGGVAVTNIGSDPVYTVDRFRMSVSSSARFTAQQITDAPTGFVNSLRITTTTASGSLTAGQYNGLLQVPEGFNCADFGFGAVGASTVTVSFWAKSSLAGTFPFSIRNYDATRSYVTSFSLPTANTWTYVTLTIPGDTSGTWNKTNSGWGYVSWTLGDSTSTQTAAINAWQSGNYTWSSGVQQPAAMLNATFQITGVQLEAGSVATPFERRDYGRELMMCQRYYISAPLQTSIFPSLSYVGVQFPVTMRASPTVAVTTGSGAVVGTVTSTTHGFNANATSGGVPTGIAYTATIEL